MIINYPIWVGILEQRLESSAPTAPPAPSWDRSQRRAPWTDAGYFYVNSELCVLGGHISACQNTGPRWIKTTYTTFYEKGFGDSIDSTSDFMVVGYEDWKMARQLSGPGTYCDTSVYGGNAMGAAYVFGPTGDVRARLTGRLEPQHIVADEMLASYFNFGRHVACSNEIIAVWGPGDTRDFDPGDSQTFPRPSIFLYDAKETVSGYYPDINLRGMPPGYSGGPPAYAILTGATGSAFGIGGDPGAAAPPYTTTNAAPYGAIKTPWVPGSPPLRTLNGERQQRNTFQTPIVVHYDRIFVCDPGYNKHEGCVYVYGTGSGNNATGQIKAIITAPDVLPGDLTSPVGAGPCFGSCVSVNDDVIVIGEPYFGHSSGHFPGSDVFSPTYDVETDAMTYTSGRVHVYDRGLNFGTTPPTTDSAHTHLYGLTGVARLLFMPVSFQVLTDACFGLNVAAFKGGFATAYQRTSPWGLHNGGMPQAPAHSASGNVYNNAGKLISVSHDGLTGYDFTVASGCLDYSYVCRPEIPGRLVLHAGDDGMIWADNHGGRGIVYTTGGKYVTTLTGEQAPLSYVNSCLRSSHDAWGRAVTINKNFIAVTAPLLGRHHAPSSSPTSSSFLLLNTVTGFGPLLGEDCPLPSVYGVYNWEADPKTYVVTGGLYTYLNTGRWIPASDTEGFKCSSPF